MAEETKEFRPKIETSYETKKEGEREKVELSKEKGEELTEESKEELEKVREEIAGEGEKELTPEERWQVTIGEAHQKLIKGEIKPPAKFSGREGLYDPHHPALLTYDLESQGYPVFVKERKGEATDQTLQGAQEELDLTREYLGDMVPHTEITQDKQNGRNVMRVWQEKVKGQNIRALGEKAFEDPIVQAQVLDYIQKAKQMYEETGILPDFHGVDTSRLGVMWPRSDWYKLEQTENIMVDEEGNLKQIHVTSKNTNLRNKNHIIGRFTSRWLMNSLEKLEEKLKAAA